MTDPIVIKPGTTTTVSVPYELTVNGDSVVSGANTQIVQAEEAPLNPWRVTVSTADADLREIQRNVGVTVDGLLGNVTLAAIKDAVKPKDDPKLCLLPNFAW
jgi:hypothetical protein